MAYKIGFYIDNLVRDGAERVTVSLADFLHRKGFHTTIITLNRADKEYAVPNGVERIQLFDEEHNRYTHFVQEIFKLRKKIVASSLDAIVVMDNTAAFFVVPACFGLRTKVIISERNDPSHFAGKKIVLKLTHHFMKKADGFVFQTDDAKKYYNSMLNGRGVVIPNPVFSERFTGIKRKAKANVIVSVGRLNPQKNQKLLINAFSKISNDYPQFNLIIYGEGCLRNELKAQIESLGMINRIFLPGNVENVLECIENAYMFVFTSNFEGMPNALIEAMALGLPSISSDCPCGGPRFLIKDGTNGLLFPVNDETKLICCMRKLLDNHEYAERLGDASVKIIKDLNMSQIGAKWMDYILDFCTEKQL